MTYNMVGRIGFVMLKQCKDEESQN